MRGTARGRVAALDLGEVRTGVAVSDPDRIIATPLVVIPSRELVDYLRRLAEEWGVREVVVGVPKTLGGEAGPQARKILATLDGLRSELPYIRFVEWDERLTTRMAAAGSRAGKKRAPRRLDHLAAARMLQEYLESGRNL